MGERYVDVGKVRSRSGALQTGARTPGPLTPRRDAVGLALRAHHACARAQLLLGQRIERRSRAADDRRVRARARRRRPRPAARSSPPPGDADRSTVLRPRHCEYRSQGGGMLRQCVGRCRSRVSARPAPHAPKAHRMTAVRGAAAPSGRRASISNRSRRGSEPISTRNSTDLDAELDRSRRSVARVQPAARSTLNRLGSPSKLDFTRLSRV